MKMLTLKPSIFSFDTCKEFADDYKICETDLVITNKDFYDHFFVHLRLTRHRLSQAHSGSGQASDRVVE